MKTVGNMSRIASLALVYRLVPIEPRTDSDFNLYQ